MIGRTFGNFEIVSQLGKGGMGEVYQAKDRKLGRDVAIKVLPEEFARDTDRVARFQREAKLLASLNHPNIASIYGLEESDGTTFLVLELIEGDTLAGRLKGGSIPVEEALKLALQIAEALEAAHEKGVIHRDLKPANIKITADGKIKILDFGLAKAFAGDQEEVNLSHSPTLSAAATQQGVILGTAAYMSPEQAKGKSVDKRTDIWAFGCVLYEMLTGQAAFQGEDVTEILAAVVKLGANLDLLPPNIHPRVREVISRCLQKELKNRYRDIGEAQFEIKQVLADPGGVFVQPAMAARTKKRLSLRLPWVAAIAVLSVIVAALAVWNLKPAPSVKPPKVVRFDHELPENQIFSQLNRLCLAASPDGTQFAYSTSSGIYLRSIDELEARFVAGTDENPERPFFSPDGKWIGYWSNSNGQLKKIAISGGASVPLTDSPALGSYHWAADDTIIFGQSGRIMRISANGGIPEILAEIGAEGTFIVSPQLLPGGKAVLFTRILPLPSMIVVQSLESGEKKELIQGDTARFLPSGHLLYEVENNLTAVPFDPDRLEVIGGPIPLIEGVYGLAAPQYAVSDSGMLVYMFGTANAAPSRKLVWVDREGREETLKSPADNYVNLKLSPDGTKVALTISPISAEIADIWVWNSARETRTRLTFSEGLNIFPIWTSDSQRVVFASIREGTLGGIYSKAADGTGEAELLGSSADTIPVPASWSKDGKILVMGDLNLNLAQGDISELSMENNGERKLLLNEKYGEDQPQISPDGAWMAYVSDESGRKEIYVRPFPDVDKGRWQISEGGGDVPLWSPDGRELFYRNGESVMSVSVEREPNPSFDTPQILFRGAYVLQSVGPLSAGTWDISPDGKRFLMMKESANETSLEEASQPKITIVLNWFEELKKRVPLK